MRTDVGAADLALADLDKLGWEDREPAISASREPNRFQDTNDADSGVRDAAIFALATLLGLLSIGIFLLPSVMYLIVAAFVIKPAQTRSQ